MASACIFLSVCCPHFEDKRELLIGLASELASRGVRTTLALAGKEACSHIIRLGGDSTECGFWFDSVRSRVVARATHLTAEVVGDRPELEAEVERLWLEATDAKKRTVRGLRLSEICRASVVRRLSAFAPAEDVETAFQKDTVRHLIYYRELIQRQQPDIAVYFGGHFHQDRTAFIACREAAVPTIAIETSFFPGCIYWDRAGVTGTRGAMSHMSILHDTQARVLSKEELRAVEALMCRSFGISSQRFENAVSDRADLRRLLGLTPDTRMALFLAQVPYDASVTTDGGHFTDQATTLVALKKALNGHTDTSMFARIHPKADVTSDPAWRTCRTLGIPVLTNHSSPLVPSLYDAMLAADVAVTVNSQSGLQAAWLGLPVVVLGHAFYSGKGFTIDAGGRADLVDACIAAALNEPRDSGAVAATAYLWGLRRHIVDDPNPATLADLVIEQLRRP